MLEDNVPFSETNPWRLPDRFELTDALSTVRQMGGTVVRMYVLTVRRTNDTPDMPRHVLGPGQFNEDAFRGSGVFLLGSVIERFLSQYVSINSFVETVLRSMDRGEIMRWPPRNSIRPIL